jgi:uncharacterized membrane protein
MQIGMAPQSTATFEAVIIPHRSLTRSGLRWLVGVICLLSTAVSLGLYFIGAWPVIGFNGAEIALAVVLLRRNARASRASEMLLLSDDGLRIVRTDIAGRRVERTLQSAWLRTGLEERPGRTPALWLSDRGGRMEVGAELGEAEKRDLATALSAALYRHRNPRFDNPQLRDDYG